MVEKWPLHIQKKAPAVPNQPIITYKKCADCLPQSIWPMWIPVIETYEDSIEVWAGADITWKLVESAYFTYTVP